MAIPEDEDVEKTLTRIMSQNSGLMKQARTQGLQSAQKAGLGQSTMGIQAAQAAAYNAAMPIASQQTQQAHQTGLQTGQFAHEVAQQEAQFGQQTGMQTAQFGHETGLQSAGFTHAASESAADRNQQSLILERSTQLDMAKATQAANEERVKLGITQAHEAEIKLLDRQAQERISAMEVSAQDRERAAAAIASVENSYAQAFAQIGANENLPADVRENYLAHASRIRESNINMMSSLYRVSGTIPW